MYSICENSAEYTSGIVYAKTALSRTAPGHILSYHMLRVLIAKTALSRTAPGHILSYHMLRVLISWIGYIYCILFVMFGFTQSGFIPFSAAVGLDWSVELVLVPDADGAAESPFQVRLRPRRESHLSGPYTYLFASSL